MPPAAIIVQRDKKIKRFDTKIVELYLKEGYLPVLYGDMVLDEKLGGSPCSGDQIVSYLGKKARRIIFGTNVDGILINGKIVGKVTNKNFKDVMDHAGGARTIDVTGGMEGKINELKKLKTPTYIVNANYPERIEELLLGKKTVCTEIKL